eukprot:TRINITY_DN78058_c0_g1_i1.p1 TRINITY_DN78058_c0_g1~~TRINITY_DN78058_c0_g1_i1.p1  ORF type:complete len:363 (-),score=31.84 TRINITY_DN78058_c0_g1_i1:87-1076(-)
MLALLDAAKQVAASYPIAIHEQVSRDAAFRLRCFAAGARMLANDSMAVLDGIKNVHLQCTELGCMTCHICGMTGLNENPLRLHLPLYHSMESAATSNPTSCPICSCEPSAFIRKSFYLHLHNEHGPLCSRERKFPIFCAFSWIVCRRRSDGYFLLVNEPAGICLGAPRYWLPAGRVDEGESFVEAGLRETLEEGGIHASVTGVLQFRLEKGIIPRIVLLAEAVEEGEPKSVPDFESCGAMWVDAASLGTLWASDFRSHDPLELYSKVADGTLCASPTDTASFAALENMVRELTKETTYQRQLSGEWQQDVTAAWESLQAEYPSSCFVIE